MQVAGTSLKCVESLRFLGVMITADGRFAPYRDSIDPGYYALRSKLSSVGLGSTPLALTRGLLVSVLPSYLFGCEIWGLSSLYSIVF